MKQRFFHVVFYKDRFKFSTTLYLTKIGTLYPQAIMQATQVLRHALSVLEAISAV